MKRTKKITAFLLVMLLTVGMLGCGGKKKNDTGKPETEQGTDAGGITEEATGGFHVSGNQLLDANGNPFVMRGVNHAHTWFKDKAAVALNAIQEAGANCIRIVLSNGEEYNVDSLKAVSALISACANRNMIVVLEVHDGTGSNKIEMVEKAVDYWIEIKEALIGNEAYAILNIINEWQGRYNQSDYESAYTDAVKRLREAGIKNTIMIDAGGWGQTAKSIAECGPAILEADPDGNTMFSIHMYGTAGKDAATIQKNIDNALEAGLCVCIGEFGYKHTDGDVDEDFLMQYCEEKKIGYLAWSWMGNGGNVSYLDLTSMWDGSRLSEEWGEKIVNGEYGLKATAVPCTVFDTKE